MELDNIDKELEIELCKYPSNFDIHVEVDALSKEYMLKIKDKLLREVDLTPYDTEMETVRAWNFISFLYFVLGNIEQAFAYNDKVLVKCSENMIALCNKSWFLCKQREDFYTINEILENLKRLVKYRTVVLVAKAENAFCYTRFGIKLCNTAGSLFKEILKECDQTRTISQSSNISDKLSSVSNTIPTINICIWRFGYALTLKRTLNINNLHDESRIDVSKQKYETVCDLYALIINMDENNNCLKRYKARSYVELGLLVFDVRKFRKFPGMMKDILPDHKDLWMATDTYFEKALQICPNDMFVLERSGKYFRYHNKRSSIERSIVLLEKVIEIRSTAFAHHHLALSLKKQLELRTTACSSIIPTEKQRVSKQLFPHTDNTEIGHQHQVSLDKQRFPTDADLKMTPAPFVVDKVVQEKQTHVLSESTDATDTYFQTGDDSGLFSMSFDPNQDPTTITTIVSCPRDSEVQLEFSSVGELSECLTGISLDSTIGTKSPILCQSFQQHLDVSITKSKNGNQAEISERDNQSHMQYWNTPTIGVSGTGYQKHFRRQNCHSAGERYGRNFRKGHDLGNKSDIHSHIPEGNTHIRGNYGIKHQNHDEYISRNGGGRFDGNSNIRHMGRRLSEPLDSYHYTEAGRYRLRGRGGRRDYNKCRGRSWQEGHTDDSVAIRKRPLTIVNMIKSPRKPPFIDKDTKREEITNIISHLDKSFELANNCGAMYDKGLLFRQTEQTKEALDIFKTLIRNEGGHCSLVQLSNAFEQAGLCLYDLLHEYGKKSDGDNGRLEFDLRRYLKRSIEISCILVAKIPFLKDCWVSAPTLESFLAGKARTKEYLKDLYFLKKKMENYSEVVSVLKELHNLAEDGTEKALVDLEIVREHLRVGNYDDSILVLDVLLCLPDGYTVIDESLYLDVNIAGGIDALKSGDIEIARLRLRNALDFVRCGRTVDNIQHVEDDADSDIQENSYDVFILCNDECEDKVSNLIESLSRFCLRATMNSLSVLPGSTKLAGTVNVMKHSKHFIVVCDAELLNRMSIYYFEMLQQVILERGHGHIVVLASSGTVLPTMLGPCNRLDMELADDIAAVDCENDVVCDKMKELMFKLASSNT